MKKSAFLVAALSLTLLTNCGGGPNPSGDVTFFSQEANITVNDKTAVLHLDWNPSGDVIEFSNFTFTLINSPITSNVTSGEAGSRPLEITIVFSSNLLNDDVGKLKFHYNDKTIKKEGDAEVNGIGVKLPPITEKRTLHFTGTNCFLKDSSGQKLPIDIIVDKGASFNCFIDGEAGFSKPKENQIDFTYTDSPLIPFTDEHSYNPATGEVSVKINEDVTIEATCDPDIPGTFDEIELPKLGYQKNVTLNAQNGKIYIKATNATEALSSDDWLNITCKLKGELQQSDSRVFSDVDITIDGGKVTSTYGTATGPLQYWYVDIESKKPTQDDLYIILTLNEEFVSEEGRIMKPNYTGEVSCVLWNLDASNKQEQIQIDYYSITKTAS